MIFELIKDFAVLLEAMPQAHPRYRILKLLNVAARRDVQFIPLLALIASGTQERHSFL